VLGEAFVFLPRFLPVEGAELDQAIGAGAALVGDPLELAKWEQRSARVHAGVAAWRRLSLYATALGRAVAPAGVAQLPHVPGARWVGLPFAAESDRPASGRISIVMHREDAPAVAKEWVGFVADRWSEVIPSACEVTGLAFHYDDAGAEAPQTVLIAVPPPAAKRWDLATLVDTLHETMDLAKIRAVDGDLLGELGQLLPAAYVASNAADDTVQVDFTAVRVADPVIAQVLT